MLGSQPLRALLSVGLRSVFPEIDSTPNSLVFYNFRTLQKNRIRPCGTRSPVGVQSRRLAGFARDSFMSAIRENVTGQAAGSGGSTLRELFDRQRAAFQSAVPDYAKRLRSLKSLEEVVLERQSEIVRAVNEDFGGRARQETLLLELAPLADLIRHAK